MDDSRSPENMQSDNNAELGTALVEQVFELWVNPELERRGLAWSREEITHVIVEMPAEDGEVKVRLNDDALIGVKGVVNRDVKAGEIVYLHDLDGIQEIIPTDVDPNSGWICYVRLGTEELVTFDLRPNKPRALSLLQKAREFLEAARVIAKTSPDVAVDNAHSAAELTVQAQMLLLRNETNDHQFRRKWFSGWAQLENSPRHHSDLLFDLANRRSEARYGDERIALKPGRLNKILATVQEMIDATASRVS